MLPRKNCKYCITYKYQHEKIDDETVIGNLLDNFQTDVGRFGLCCRKFNRSIAKFTCVVGRHKPSALPRSTPHRKITMQRLRKTRKKSIYNHHVPFSVASSIFGTLVATLSTRQKTDHCVHRQYLSRFGPPGGEQLLLDLDSTMNECLGDNDMQQI